MAWNLVRHSFAMVFGNLRYALNTFLVPLAVMFGVQILLSMVFNTPLYYDPTVTQQPATERSAVFVSLLVLPLYLFVGAWLASTWHRFILLEEYPDKVPAVNNRNIGAYVKRTLMIGLQLSIVFLLMVVVIILTVSNGFPTLGLNASTPMGFLFMTILGVLYLYPFLRIGISLPAVAVGKPIYSVDAWRETKPIWPSILGASLILILLQLGLGFLVATLFAPVPILAFSLGLVAQALNVIIGVSILTTIYGYVIEKRPLNS